MLDTTSSVERRFLRYVQIDTQSDENSASVPSTQKQFDLLRLLQQELEALGVQDVQLLDSGFVLATIPATVDAVAAPRIGFLAHVDTAPAFNGTGVKPIVHRNYDGAPIVLPDDPTQVLSPIDNPYLALKSGDDIVTASGTTLLGADDKAGVAIIMTLVERLLAEPSIPHGELRICFTTDEEIGSGISHLDTADLGVDWAYTLDGGELGRLVGETFSADKAVVTISGVSAHPGAALGKMVNALHLAATIIDTLPQHTRTPETTSGREGFLHVYHMSGSVAHAELSFILRDFELERLAQHGEVLRTVCAAVQATEPRSNITCTITPQYRNMRYWLEHDQRPIDVAMAAMREVGIEPLFEPTRGGTDGSQLTERGILTPNLFTGMQNIHGPLEWISVQDMAKAVDMCLALARIVAKSVQSEGHTT